MTNNFGTGRARRTIWLPGAVILSRTWPGCAEQVTPQGTQVPAQLSRITLLFQEKRVHQGRVASLATPRLVPVHLARRNDVHRTG